jgi:hypothetical protein
MHIAYTLYSKNLTFKFNHMKKLFFFNGLFAALLCACTAEDNIISEIPVNGGTTEGVVIDVMDAHSDNTTRTAYSGLTATFETGDAIGVYAVDGTGTVQASNIQFTKQSDGSWSSETLIPYNATWSYYAYFPYVASPYTPDFSLSGVDNQFGAFITDASDKFHNADQSTKANFMASDLMISMGTSTGSSKVLFAMYHKKALAVLQGEGVNMKSYSGNIPYLQDGKRYFLMKANTEYTVGGYALSAAAGKAINCVVPIPPYEEQYLTLVALEDGSFSSKTAYYYSLDGGATWTYLVGNTSLPVTTGQKVMWKGNNNYIQSFTSTGKFDVLGNVMSILFGDNYIGKNSLIVSGTQYSLSSLFENTKIRNAENLILPATTLKSNCYQSMFEGCSYLTDAPSVLPATTLEYGCYYNMFKGCANLISTPEIRATTLANWCCYSMFSDCTSLTTAPELPATTLTANCYSNMFKGCMSLTTVPDLPATTVGNASCEYMFQGCTSLTTAPKLPATTLNQLCYRYMFQGCTSLTTAPELLATTLANNCYSYMFSDCTSLTTAPELPSKTLVDGCYNYMFMNCSKLNYIKAAFTNDPGFGYTSSWVSGVSSTGTFVKNRTAYWDKSGPSGIPSGWTIETYTP